MNDAANPAPADAVQPEDADTSLATESQDTEEKAPKIDVVVEDTGPARKKLAITIPGSRITEKLEEQLNELEADAQVPGFRKGRVPRRLIEKRFGKTLRNDMRNQLVGEYYHQVLEQEDLVVVGDPEFDGLEDAELPDDGSDMTVTVNIEVVPNFDLPDYYEVEVAREAKEVTDKDIEEQIKMEQRRRATPELLEEEAAAAGDVLQGEVRVLAGADAGDDATELLNFPMSNIFIPEEDDEEKNGPIGGILVDDLPTLTIGKKAGDVIRVSTTGPQNHEDDRIKNQAITIVAKIESVFRLVTMSEDELAKAYGHEDGQSLRKMLQENMLARREVEADNDAKRQICEYLLEKVEMDLPEGFSDRQLNRVLMRQAAQLESDGVPHEEIERRLAETRSSTEEASRKEMKLFFTLARIAEQLDLDVTPQEVNSRIFQVAMSRGQRPERVREELERSGQIEQLFMQIREEKTLNALLARAKVNGQEPEVGRPSTDE